jgi:hypothetical protein
MRRLKTTRSRARVTAALAGVITVVSALAAGCGGSTLGQVQATVEAGGDHFGLGATGAAADRPTTDGPTAAQIARFRWSVRPASPLGARSQPVLAWTGRELIELGGLAHGASRYAGVAFDPATGWWRRIAPTGARNVGFTNAVSVWTGRQLFVSNGQSGLCTGPQGGGGAPANCWPQAGLYDPATNRWSATRLPGPMGGLQLTAAVWTGHDVILAGVNGGRTGANRGRLGVAAFEPATGRWQMITPALPSGHPPQAVEMVATPGRILLWSLWERYGHSPGAGVDVLALGPGGGWRDVTGPWPQEENVTSPVYTGSAILVSPGQIWCGGSCAPPYTWNPGYFTDPVTLARKTIPLGPLGQTNPTFVWTGRAIIAVNLGADIGGHDGQPAIRPDDMALCDPALWDPAASRWLSLPAPPGYPGLLVTPVWTGTELLALTAAGHLLAFHG